MAVSLPLNIHRILSSFFMWIKGLGNTPIIYSNLKKGENHA